MGSVSSMVAGIQDVLRPQPLKYDPLDQDADVIFQPTSRDQLLLQCQTNLNQEDLPPAFPRNWSSSFPQHTSCKTSSKRYLYQNIFVKKTVFSRDSDVTSSIVRLLVS